MPMGTWHRETGTLAWTDVGYQLQLPGGGYWTLYLPRWSYKRMIGNPVYVIGLRVGFNMLDVTKVWLVGEPEPISLSKRLGRLLKQVL